MTGIYCVSCRRPSKLHILQLKGPCLCSGFLKISRPFSRLPQNQDYLARIFGYRCGPKLEKCNLEFVYALSVFEGQGPLMHRV